MGELGNWMLLGNDHVMSLNEKGNELRRRRLHNDFLGGKNIRWE